MFVTVVIRALSRLPSRTARVRLELVPRAVVVAVAVPRTSSWCRDDVRRDRRGPGLGRAAVLRHGPVPAGGTAPPAAEGGSPAPYDGSPGVAVGRPCCVRPRGRRLMHVAGTPITSAAPGRRRPGYEDRGSPPARVTDAPPKPPLSTEFPGAGGVSSRAPRAPGACPRAARGPRGSRGTRAAATVAASTSRETRFAGRRRRWWWRSARSCASSATRSARLSRRPWRDGGCCRRPRRGNPRRRRRTRRRR